MSERKPEEITDQLYRQFIFVAHQMDDLMSNVNGSPTLPQMADMERYSATMSNLMSAIVESKKLV